MAGVYDRLASYYDVVYGDVFDHPFYLREALKAEGPVLEIGCGTGRVLLFLAGLGIDITGMDRSRSMLKELRRKAKEQKLKPRITQGDMRGFSLKRKFKLIILPYRGFLHLKDDKERLMALRSIRRHLMPGGSVIIHTYNPGEDELEMTEKLHDIEKEAVEVDG